MVSAVESARGRYTDDPDLFDDHLKVFGIHDAGLRSWIVRRIARHLGDVDVQVGEDLVHWRPPSGGYVALGMWQDFAISGYEIAEGFIRFAAVRRTSLELVNRVAYATGIDHATVVSFPDGYGQRAEARRYRTLSQHATCPTCFTQLPATGLCDDCD